LLEGKRGLRLMLTVLVLAGLAAIVVIARAIFLAVQVVRERQRSEFATPTETDLINNAALSALVPELDDRSDLAPYLEGSASVGAALSSSLGAALLFPGLLGILGGVLLGKAAAKTHEERKADRALSPEQQQAIAFARAASKLLYQVPARMYVRETASVEVRIGNERMRGFASGFVSDQPVQEEHLTTVERMSVTLRGDTGAFQIVQQSMPKQLIGGAASDEFRAQQFGRWLFEVTPQKLGKHSLFITVSGEIANANRALPDRTFEVTVGVGLGSIVRQAAIQLGAVGGLLLGAFVGAATQDLWWPGVRSGLERAGIITPLDDRSE
jgi:hypothetical protein